MSDNNNDNNNQTLGNGPDDAKAVKNNRWRGADEDFRGGENEFDENSDLPSINRKRNNKLITAVGYVFMGLVALAAIFAVNRSPSEAPKRETTAKVGNRLPSFSLPDAPPAPPVVPSVEEIPPVADTSEDDIFKRKTGGNLVLSGGNNSGAGAGGGAGNRGTGPRSTSDAEQERAAYLAAYSAQSSGNTGGAGPGGPTGGAMQAVAAEGGGAAANPASLGARLKPTITDMVGANILPNRDFVLAKGTSLDCALETAIDSSMPGMTTCRLTRDVYSDNGRVLLLDRGSQLVGEYEGALRQGQARMFLLWTRAKTPTGVVVALDSPGIDSLGRSGISGHVDNHFWTRFGAAILTSLVKDSITTLVNNRSQKDGGGGGTTTNIYSNTTSSTERIVGSMLEQHANIPPTLIVNQGVHVQVMVARDLDFSSVYGLRVRQ